MPRNFLYFWNNKIHVSSSGRNKVAQNKKMKISTNALSDISWKISAKKVSKAWSILLIFKYATYKTMFWDLESIMQMLKYL